ncbi:MAG: hypothetical protein CMI96_01205 [Pelagibacteraceae bacterium]|nr:hypothetical protein [Pelagibacteraceae bacterium]|tara:strand:+ start:40598 stop:41359 length:762 start_codon:yes stop_codon:yes gene_type:complete
MNKRITVILPAAGKGSRLLLPYPKELMKINESHSLIDYTFDLFKKKCKAQFVVVINEKKLSLIEYLSKYKNIFNISFVFQKDRYKEITGAIKSAENLFSDYNLVLLPDTIVQLYRRKYLSLDEVVNRTKKTGFSFLYKKENSIIKLKQMGCLKIIDNKCENYEDKPTTKINDFNAFWAGFAFDKNKYYESIKIIESSTLRKKLNYNQFKQSPLHMSEGIEIKNQLDLGTWNNIRKRLLKDYLINHGIESSIIK